MEQEHEAAGGETCNLAVGGALEPLTDGGARPPMHGEEGVGAAPQETATDVAHTPHAALDCCPAAGAGPADGDLLDAAGEATAPGGGAQSTLDEVEDGSAGGEDDEGLAPEQDDGRAASSVDRSVPGGAAEF